MRRLNAVISTLLVLCWMNLGAVASEAENTDPNELVQWKADSFQHEGQDYLMLVFQNKKEWHTYWKNPGDAGTPFQFDFQLKGKSYTWESLEWPAPHKFKQPGDMIAYGYDGQYAFFFPLSQQVKNDLKKMGHDSLTLKMHWLVCKHICIPGEAEAKAQYNGQKLAWTDNFTGRFTVTDGQKKALFESLPVEYHADKDASNPAKLQTLLVRSKDKKNLILYYQLTEAPLQTLEEDRNLLTPYPEKIMTFHGEKIRHDGGTRRLYGKTEIDWDGEYVEGGPIYLPKNGVFTKPLNLKFLWQQKGLERPRMVTMEFKRIDSDQHDMVKAYEGLPEIPAAGDSLSDLAKRGINSTGLSAIGTQGTQGAAAQFFFYLFMAYLGGLILNLMPCVLPVISLKLFGLMTIAKKSQGQILRHNLFYTLGVLSSFLLLGLIVIGIKAGGDQVGWGFHLQSPHFVLCMLLLLVILSFNLFGLFEFGVPWGRRIGSIEEGEGDLGAFGSGILSTLLSTPCSAPFLGTALTFAFASSSLMVLGLFMGIGLGLATPFLVIGFFPRTLNFLPKPGAWMEGLKRVLGFVILLTGVWLFDVLFHLVDPRMYLMGVLILLSFLFFSFYYKKNGRLSLMKGLLFLATFILGVTILMNLQRAEVAGHGSQVKSQGRLTWKPWSLAALEEMRNQRQLVFMDFTAEWCFTCKANEKLVLSREGFAELVEKHQVKLLLADWTSKDDVITQWLKEREVVGVPAYFIQYPDGTQKSLGELVTLGKIEEALKATTATAKD